MICPICNKKGFYVNEESRTFTCKECSTVIGPDSDHYCKAILRMGIEEENWIEAIKALRLFSSLRGCTLGLKEAKMIVDTFREYIPKG